MKIKTMVQKIKNLPKRYFVAAALGLAVAIPAVTLAGYGPNRPTFDWNNPADRGGSMNGPVFNSFVNTPYYGDERSFVDAKDAANTTPGGFADTVNVDSGKEYTIRAYVHNNANPGTNASGVGVAKNTNVRFKVLSGTANGNEVTGYVSADNATPQIVYDTVKLKNDAKAFALEYVPGSARIENNAHPFPGVTLSDSIVSDQGATIGYDQMNGDMPGCFEFESIVTIKVRVKAPALQVSKHVSSVASPKLTESQKNLEAKAGDTVSWRLDYKNNGTDVAHNVTIRDSLPKGLTLVPGSIKLVTAATPEGKVLQDTALSSGGVDVGDYFPNGNGLIRFQTKIANNIREIEPDCVIENVVFGQAQNIPDTSDKATVTIKDCNQPPAPSYSCDALVAQPVSAGSRTYRFTANTSVSGGASIRRYIFNFGDNSQVVSTDKSVVEHTYDNGSYLASVKAEVAVNGQTKVAEGPQCTAAIPPVTVPPVTPTTPTATVTTLPATGAGSVAAVFAAATVAGAMAYQVFVSRRLNR